MVRLKLTLPPRAHLVPSLNSLIPKLSRSLSFVYLIRVVELFVDKSWKSSLVFRSLNNAQFRIGSEAALAA